MDLFKTSHSPAILQVGGGCECERVVA